MGKKISLVLEGGGMRGAFTAGALSWLIDQGIEFDCVYGISTGAVYASSFLIGEKRYLYELSTEYIIDKKIVGWRPFLREGHIVGYDYLFSTIMEKVFKFDVDRVNKAKHIGKVGMYDLSQGKTIFMNTRDIDLMHLKAATSLPILGKIVKYEGKEYLDGGITEMIPIHEALNDGMDRHIIITTKPGNYVRKKSNPFVNWLMGVIYHRFPSVKKDYMVRHLNYVDQISLIKDLEEKKEAVYIYPTETLKVSRISGDQATLKKLFDLGYQDMEAKKEEIYELIKGL